MSETVEDFALAFYPFLREDDERSQELKWDLRFSLLEKAREITEGRDEIH